jgi:hypothetical protein
MTRFAKYLCALGLLSAAPSAQASYLCLIELIEYEHWYWDPPYGSCALATYDIAEEHCGNVWNDHWVATTQPYDWKSASLPRSYEWDCVDGEVANFTW